MALFSKLFTFALIAYVTALPKIQHRADGNSEFDISQYLNSEKLQGYFKENPTAFNYFSVPGQSPSNNAVQSDTMSDSQSSSSYTDKYAEAVKACMESYQAGYSGGSTSSATNNAGKAENSNPFEQFYPQNNNYFGNAQNESFQKCLKQWQSQANYPSGIPNYSPNGLNGYQPNFPQSNNIPYVPSNYFPNSNSGAGSSSSS